MSAGVPAAAPGSVLIAGPAGSLEAVIEQPAPGAGPPPLIAVLCHPHPLFGGTLQNKVVHTLARTLRAAGAATLRFNFRGVGASEGTHDGGAGETQDALAAVAWARARWSGAPLVLAGFSFGGAVAIQAAGSAAPAWLITVAPAVDRLNLEQLELPHCDWLVVQGDADDVVSADSVVQWMTRWAPQARVRVLPGVGHFFHGRLHELQACLREEWPRTLPVDGRA
ncbi:MAG TPA: alpha/beta fold hydrolase, partial [Steroidobacteraceae bacterium]|nr:alpha/beta fold hydrolase [Steroidobacteraceae bacterium]